MSYSDGYGYADNYADSEIAPHETDEHVHSEFLWADVWLLVHRAYVAGFEQARRDIRDAI